MIKTTVIEIHPVNEHYALKPECVEEEYAEVADIEAWDVGGTTDPEAEVQLDTECAG